MGLKLIHSSSNDISEDVASTSPGCIGKYIFAFLPMLSSISLYIQVD